MNIDQAMKDYPRTMARIMERADEIADAMETTLLADNAVLHDGELLVKFVTVVPGARTIAIGRPALEAAALSIV